MLLFQLIGGDESHFRTIRFQVISFAVLTKFRLGLRFPVKLNRGITTDERKFNGKDILSF